MEMDWQKKIDRFFLCHLINTHINMDVNIQSSIEQQCEYFNIQNKKEQDMIKEGETRNSNHEPTPIHLCFDMVKAIPSSFWETKDLKILDPCCGNGNFFIPVISFLLKKYSINYILENILFFNDTCKERLEFVKTFFMNQEYDLNVKQTDYLTYEDTEEYNLVLANPPYAKLLSNGKRASKNHNLIGPFLRKTLKILKPDGYLVFITPDNWMSLADKNTLIQELTSLQIEYLNIHTAKKYFPKIGSSFTWYVIQKKPVYKPMIVEGIWKGKSYKEEINYSTRDYIPQYYTSIIHSILSKTIDNSELTKFKVETSSNLHKYTKQHLLHTEKGLYTKTYKYCDNCKKELHLPPDIKKHEDKEKCGSSVPVIKEKQVELDFKYRCIHTPKQTVWSCQPHKFQKGYKVFISTTTNFQVFIDNCGMTQSIVFIRCKTKQQAENIKKIIEHPLFVFINNICRWGNFNNIRILQRFPFHDKYETLYDFLGITKEEKEFIKTQ